MTFSHGVGYKFRKAWFPWKRFLRALKRAVLSLKTWVSTLTLFIPLAGLILLILVYAGLFCAVEAVKEFVLILLGSFLLLAIKEIRDSEARRKQILKSQWSYYCRWKSELTQHLISIAKCMGYTIRNWQLLSSQTEVDNVFSALTPNEMQNSCDAQEEYEHHICEIRNIANQILQQAERSEFIDWDSARASYLVFDEICEQINTLKANWPERDTTQLKILSRELNEALALVRRPWRYRNDMAHKELLTRYVEQYGVKYQ